MSLAEYLLAGFGLVAALTLIGAAWLLGCGHVRPRDLSDDEPCSDWDGRS